MLYLQPLVLKYLSARNEEKAVQMSKYMKNLFPFIGIPKPLRTVFEREFFKENGLPEKEKLFDIIFYLWDLPEREYQYFALILLQKFKTKLEHDDINSLEKLIVNKSWWDTVDAIAVWFCGSYFKKYPGQISVTTKKWMESGNFWLQRSALLFQLQYKNQTNTHLLSEYITQLAGSNEFFIRKAIGWVLREYSKTNSAWVKQFVDTHTLSGLSYREATKYL